MIERPKILRQNRAIIRLLGRLLGEVIHEQRGQQAFRLVEDIRRQSVGEHRVGPLSEKNGEIAPDGLKDLGQSKISLLIRVFSIFSQLANTTDDHIARRETKALDSAAAQRP